MVPQTLIAIHNVLQIVDLRGWVATKLIFLHFRTGGDRLWVGDPIFW